VTQIAKASLAQRGHLFGWVPVCIGTGIGLYFALRVEPVVADYLVLAALAVVLLALVRPVGAVWSPVLLALVLVIAGFCLTGLRAQMVAAPVLGFRYYGPIEGRIVAIDRSAKDAVRLTLDHVVLDRMSPGRTPDRVRLSLYGQQDWIDPQPSLWVMTTGHLSPPNGPAEPGDFDFRRMAWFGGLGAVGYTRNPVLALAPVEAGRVDLAVDRLRSRLSLAIRSRIPGDAGGYAAAVMTGDRSGLSGRANDDMRAANLYHLVSISGMHMGMLAGFVFGLVRIGAAMIPPLALRFDAKKIAALMALPAAAFYLALAGGDVPTERAFVMVAVMLVAVLLDRRGLSLRSVSIAALVVMGLRPESLINPGFQMSFAAVVALIFVFQRTPVYRGDRPLMRWVIVPGALLLLSSLVAGTATAPYAAAHFNRVAHYGLVANLLAVPAMGMMVMPGAVILAILGPLGLEQPALWMIETGSRWILFVASEVAATPGAMSAVVRPPDAMLPLLTLGLLTLILWQGRLRWIGALPVLVAAALWVGASRPDLLVADSGGLIGVMAEPGRSLSKPRGDGFAAGIWLENDGVLTTQEEAATPGGFGQQDRVSRAVIGGTHVLQVSGITALARLEGCDGADLLIANVEVEGSRPCEVYDIRRLRETGALAGRLVEGVLEINTVADRTGNRPWTGSRVGAWAWQDGRGGLMAALWRNAQ